MSDIIDRAKKLEQEQRDRALKAARHRPKETPLIVNGITCCLACEQPISAARLAANPEAVRCIECQQDHEKYGRR